MMRLEDMQRRLDGAGVGAMGTDLFIYSMPAEVTRGVMLTPGASGDAVNHEVPGYRPAASFQIVVRALEHEDGFALMARAVKAATITQPIALGPYRINHARPRHDAVVTPRADGNGLEFSVAFDVNLVVLPDVIN